jgi:hypothetical protein
MQLEELWKTLTGPERISLFVLSDILTRRGKVVSVEGAAINSVRAINRGLETLDSTALFPDAHSYLVRFLEENPVERFDELYLKLVVEI